MPNIVKITTPITPLDLVAPHSCRGCGRIGSPLCDCCKNHIIKSHQNICPQCKEQTKSGKCKNCKNLPLVYSLGRRYGVLDELIHELKYNSARSISIQLADILNQTLPEFKSPIIIVPLPTISKHIRERGLDHTRLIAKKLAKKRSNFTLQPLLLRANNTVQVGSDRKTRLAQAKSAYQINPKYNIDPNFTYLLFDDIWTTGASMQAARKKLQQAGAKNIILSVLAIS